MLGKRRTVRLRNIQLITAKLKSVEKRIEECRYIIDTVGDTETVSHFTDVLADLKELQRKYSDKLKEVKHNGKQCSCS